ERLLDASPDRPAEMGIAVGCGVEEITLQIPFERQLGPADRDTAGRIEEPGVHGVAEACAQRRLPAGPQGQRAGKALVVGIDDGLVAIEIGVIDVALDAEDEIATLPVVAEMGAADKAVNVESIGW